MILATPNRLSTPPLRRPLPSAPASPLTPAETEELRLWEHRYQPQLGLLKTPPLNPAANPDHSPPFRPPTPGGDPGGSRAYVEELVQKLAGEELKQQGIQLRVEVFSGDVPQAAIDDKDDQEKNWQSQHPDQPWPIRTWLNAPKDGQRPLYRLVISQGLLRELDTREQLGFVVAHELVRLIAHDKKDPNNQETLECSSRSWLDSHEMQAGVDYSAVNMMCRAGLNPEGALAALDRLYDRFPLVYPKDDQKTALGAAAQGQEHEGVRIAVMQAQVERLRRSGEPATLHPSQPLPPLAAPGPAQYDVQVQDFARFQKAFNELALSLTAGTPAWMFGNAAPPPEVAYLRSTTACSQDYEKALMGACETLTAAAASGQQKADGLLRLLLALKGQCLPAEFSAASREGLGTFLSRQDWQVQPFLDSLSGPDGKSLHRDLVRNLNFNSTFQKILCPHPSLLPLADGAAANYCRRPENGQPDLDALAAFLKNNPAGQPLSGRHQDSSLPYLQQQKPAELAAQPHSSGLSQGLVLCNQLRSLELPADFAGRLRTAMQPIQEAANGRREEHARLRLRPPLAEPEKLNAYLRGLFESENGSPFTPAFEEQLPGLLRDLVGSCNTQPDLVYDSGRPLELEEGLERRLCQWLGKAEVKERPGLVRYLARQWAHELRLPTHSPRRQWTGELNRYYESLSRQQVVETLSQPDLSQHAGRIRQLLTEGYRLKPEDLPDVSTESLKKLDERKEAGEFLPRQEDYANPADYALALKDYQARQERMKLASRFLVAAEARPVLSQLAMLGQDLDTSRKVAEKLTPEDFQNILVGAEKAVERSKVLRHVCNDQAVEALGSDGGAFLMDGFLAVEKDIPELERFYDLATRAMKLCPAATEARGDTRDRFGDSLFPRLQKLAPEELRQWLGKDHVLQALKGRQTADLLLQYLGDQAKEGADVTTLAGTIAELDKGLRLQEKFPLAYVLLRDDVSLQARLQPHTVDQVFPPDPRNPIEQVSIFRGQAAGLSGLVAMTRNHSPEDQLATIEYLMGRRDEMPAFLEMASENQNLGPVAQALRNARKELSEADPIARVMVANSFLAGPTGLLHRPGGKEAIMAKMLKGVLPKFMALATQMCKAILHSQGDTDSLAVAFVLGQKPKVSLAGESNLTAADILNRVFDSYGVPGIKMKQYLAFTSEFADFREVFESAQDAAMPLTYYQVVKLIQKRFGNDWPADLKVDKVLGSGSVNLAIRYTDTRTGKREVVSLGREDIIEATRYDFERFKKFTAALTTTPEDKEKFGYIGGLSKIIQDSVTLEFDKESAMAVQKQAFNTYKHKYNGWTVRSIDAYRVQHLGLFMEEAKGKTARKILDQNPELYRQALRPMARAEMGILKGQDSTGNLVPVPTFANPDFHDGQVLVDEANKTVTILDFGQAVPISNSERELALDLITVMGKIDTLGQATKRLNKRFFPNADALHPGLTKEDLKPILARPKKMDIFIHLLSLLSRKGADVPISTVHWVLGLNRQLVLGEKLGQSIKPQLVGMVLNHKLGLPLGVYNTIYSVNQKIKEAAAGLAHGLFGWALPKAEEENQNIFRSAPQPEGDRRWHDESGWGWYPFEPEADPESKK